MTENENYELDPALHEIQLHRGREQ
jgi:hypothetical protein